MITNYKIIVGVLSWWKRA